MTKDCFFNKMSVIVAFRHIRKIVFDNYLCRKTSWLPRKRRQAVNIFRKLELYDIIQEQPEVAKKQIQIGGKIKNKTVYSCQKEGGNNEFF